MQKSSLTSRTRLSQHQRTPAETRQLRGLTDFNWAVGFLGQYHELQTMFGSTNAPITSPTIDVSYDLIDETESSCLKRNNNFGYAYAQKLKDITEYIVHKADNNSKNIAMDSLVEDPEINVRKPSSFTVPALSTRPFQSIKLVQSTSFQTRERGEQTYTRGYEEETPTLAANNNRSYSPEFNNENVGDESRSHTEGGDHPVYLDDSRNLQHSQQRGNGLYVITDKPVSQRYWQVKFEQKPQIPIKQVDLSRKAQRQVQAELEESQEVEHETFSPQFQGLNETNRNMYSEQTSPYENPFQKAKYLPYFQYSASNLKSAGFRSALTERSLSPMSSPVKSSGFKQFMDSEVLYISKGVPSSGMKDGFMSAINNPNCAPFGEESTAGSPKKSTSSVTDVDESEDDELEVDKGNES